MSDSKGLLRLLEVMARLRDPEHGCPWDRAQTPASIAPYTIEEACEVAEAAEGADPLRLREELGDLLFHVVFHTRMAQECGWFDFDEVAAFAASKLERRHPQVFAHDADRDSDAGPPAWERRKAAQRDHIDDHLPPQLPALMAACKLQRRAAAVGFDWPEADGARAKILEELAELDAASAEGPAAATEELGDLLFAVVNVARHLDIEPEQALREANRKFTRRFRYIEARLRARGGRPEDVALVELDALWEEAKRAERAASVPD